MTGTVTERLAAFLAQGWREGAPPAVLHETKRLVLNQLKASVAATDAKPAILLRDWALREAVARPQARLLWYGDRVNREQAAMVNAALFEVLDFHDTYIPCFMHAVSGVMPAVFAEAEALGASGADTLKALALGVEAELACAAILMPTAYFRGFIAGALTGAIGGAAGCALLRGLDEGRTADALGLAMNQGQGQYVTAGADGFAYIMGSAARNGLTSAELADAGMTAPRKAFEGEKGMLTSYSDEPAEKIATVLDGLGADPSGAGWRLMGQTYKTIPTETITHGPVEGVLALRERAAGRRPKALRFGVEAIVIRIADERAQRFGAPSSTYEAKFDLRHCAAAAWERGRFTLAEMEPEAFTDPAVLDLRSRIGLFHDERHRTFDGASAEVEYEDGSTDSVNIPAFKGTPANPLSDEDLAALFHTYAEPRLPAGRAAAITESVWALDAAPTLDPLLSLCTTA